MVKKQVLEQRTRLEMLEEESGDTQKDGTSAPRQLLSQIKSSSSCNVPD